MSAAVDQDQTPSAAKAEPSFTPLGQPTRESMDAVQASQLTFEEVLAAFKDDILVSGEQVRFTARGRARLEEWYEPWGISLNEIRTVSQLQEAWAKWSHLSADEDRALLEMDYWEIDDAEERKKIVEVLGYVPPAPLNLEEVERQTRWKRFKAWWADSWAFFKETTAGDLEKLAKKLKG